MWEMLVIAFFVCVVEKTGFLCDDRLKDLLYIKDGDEEQSPSTEESINGEEEGNEIEEEVIEEVKPKPKPKPKPQPQSQKENKVQEKNDSNLNSFDDIDFSDFEKDNTKSSAFDDIQINKEALFGEGFLEEEEPPLMEDLNDIAASILSDIYGG
ncbi:hypothetical protein UT300012_23190 [Paraclostridium bifermentans]